MPIRRFWPQALCDQPFLKDRQLVDEGRPDLEVGPSRVEELQSFQQGPSVSPHHVCCYNNTRPALTSD